MYVTYRYYADEYGGKIIEEKRFSVMERRAKAYIRQLTYVHGDIFALDNDAVKDAVCAAAEAYYSMKQIGRQPELLSQRIRTVTVSPM